MSSVLPNDHEKPHLSAYHELFKDLCGIKSELLDEKRMMERDLSSFRSRTKQEIVQLKRQVDTMEWMLASQRDALFSVDPAEVPPPVPYRATVQKVTCALKPALKSCRELLELHPSDKLAISLKVLLCIGEKIQTMTAERSTGMISEDSSSDSDSELEYTEACESRSQVDVRTALNTSASSVVDVGGRGGAKMSEMGGAKEAEVSGTKAGGGEERKACGVEKEAKEEKGKAAENHLPGTKEENDKTTVPVPHFTEAKKEEAAAVQGARTGDQEGEKNQPCSAELSDIVLYLGGERKEAASAGAAQNDSPVKQEDDGAKIAALTAQGGEKKEAKMVALAPSEDVDDKKEKKEEASKTDQAERKKMSSAELSDIVLDLGAGQRKPEAQHAQEPPQDKKEETAGATKTDLECEMLSLDAETKGKKEEAVEEKKDPEQEGEK